MYKFCSSIFIFTVYSFNYVAFKEIFEKIGYKKDCQPEEKRIIVNLWNDVKNLAQIVEILNCWRKMI